MAAEPSQRLGLGRAARIKQGRDFRRAREQGQRLAIGCLLMNWLAQPPGSTSRLGVVTPGRLGTAVERNRARRLIREAYRQHQGDLATPADIVLVARASIIGKSYTQVERDFLNLLGRARLKKADQA